MSEFVYVIPSDEAAYIVNSGYFGENWTGVSDRSYSRSKKIVEEVGGFIPREIAEVYEGYLQAIPYTVFIFGGSVSYYERAGSEKRLHGLGSIGYGGHINLCDKSPDGGLIENARRREIREELGIELSDPVLVHSGFVWDYTTDVGRVHFGIFEIISMEVPGMVLTSDIDVGKLENWSQKLWPLIQLWDSDVALCRD
jgi:predicted NUDIX family phosphoesterase